MKVDRKEEGGREGEKLEESSGDSMKLKSPAKKEGREQSTERRELTKRDWKWALLGPVRR